MRCSSPTTCEKLRGLLGADLARSVLPPRDELHRDRGGRAVGRAQRSAPVPQPPRVPLQRTPARADRASTCRPTSRSASRSRRCGSTTTATSASSARPRTSRGATSTCCWRSRRDGRHRTPFFHYNLGSEYFADRRDRQGAGRVRAGLRECSRSDGTLGHEYVPSLTIRSVKALRAAGRNEDAIERADIGLERFPGLHRSRLRARARIDRAGPDR